MPDWGKRELDEVGLGGGGGGSLSLSSETGSRDSLAELAALQAAILQEGGDDGGWAPLDQPPQQGGEPREQEQGEEDGEGEEEIGGGLGGDWEHTMRLGNSMLAALADPQLGGFQLAVPAEGGEALPVHMLATPRLSAIAEEAEEGEGEEEGEEGDGAESSTTAGVEAALAAALEAAEAASSVSGATTAAVESALASAIEAPEVASSVSGATTAGVDAALAAALEAAEAGSSVSGATAAAIEEAAEAVRGLLGGIEEEDEAGEGEGEGGVADWGGGGGDGEVMGGEEAGEPAEVFAPEAAADYLLAGGEAALGVADAPGEGEQAAATAEEEGKEEEEEEEEQEEEKEAAVSREARALPAVQPLDGCRRHRRPPPPGPPARRRPPGDAAAPAAGAATPRQRQLDGGVPGSGGRVFNVSATDMGGEASDPSVWPAPKGAARGSVPAGSASLMASRSFSSPHVDMALVGSGGAAGSRAGSAADRSTWASAFELGEQLVAEGRRRAASPGQRAAQRYASEMRQLLGEDWLGNEDGGEEALPKEVEAALRRSSADRRRRQQVASEKQAWLERSPYAAAHQRSRTPTPGTERHGVPLPKSGARPRLAQPPLRPSSGAAADKGRTVQSAGPLTWHFCRPNSSSAAAASSTAPRPATPNQHASEAPYGTGGIMADFGRRFFSPDAKALRPRSPSRRVTPPCVQRPLTADSPAYEVKSRVAEDLAKLQAAPRPSSGAAVHARAVGLTTRQHGSSLGTQAWTQISARKGAAGAMSKPPSGSNGKSTGRNGSYRAATATASAAERKLTGRSTVLPRRADSGGGYPFHGKRLSFSAGPTVRRQRTPSPPHSREATRATALSNGHSHAGSHRRRSEPSDAPSLSPAPTGRSTIVPKYSAPPGSKVHPGVRSAMGYTYTRSADFFAEVKVPERIGRESATQRRRTSDERAWEESRRAATNLMSSQGTSEQYLDSRPTAYVDGSIAENRQATAEDAGPGTTASFAAELSTLGDVDASPDMLAHQTEPAGSDAVEFIAVQGPDERSSAMAGGDSASIAPSIALPAQAPELGDGERRDVATSVYGDGSQNITAAPIVAPGSEPALGIATAPLAATSESAASDMRFPPPAPQHGKETTTLATTATARAADRPIAGSIAAGASPPKPGAHPPPFDAHNRERTTTSAAAGLAPVAKKIAPGGGALSAAPHQPTADPSQVDFPCEDRAAAESGHARVDKAPAELAQQQLSAGTAEPGGISPQASSHSNLDTPGARAPHRPAGPRPVSLQVSTKPTSRSGSSRSPSPSPSPGGGRSSPDLVAPPSWSAEARAADSQPTEMRKYGAELRWPDSPTMAPPSRDGSAFSLAGSERSNGSAGAAIKHSVAESLGPPTASRHGKHGGAAGRREEGATSPPSRSRSSKSLVGDDLAPESSAASSEPLGLSGPSAASFIHWNTADKPPPPADAVAASTSTAPAVGVSPGRRSTADTVSLRVNSNTSSRASDHASTGGSEPSLLFGGVSPAREAPGSGPLPAARPFGTASIRPPPLPPARTPPPLEYPGTPPAPADHAAPSLALTGGYQAAVAARLAAQQGQQGPATVPAYSISPTSSADGGDLAGRYAAAVDRRVDTGMRMLSGRQAMMRPASPAPLPAGPAVTAAPSLMQTYASATDAKLTSSMRQRPGAPASGSAAASPLAASDLLMAKYSTAATSSFDRRTQQLGYTS
eukprot:jgi/Tetstr1/443608/TSEL_031607.t1